jgi:hypothetical protein
MSTRIKLVIVALVAALPLAVAPAAGARIACLPEPGPPSPVCDEIIGVSGGFAYAFTIGSPAPDSPAAPPEACGALTFAVNGRPARGALRCDQVDSFVFGTFEPSSPLLVGDEVCMTVPWLKPSEQCETVPDFSTA